jgi:hypothetical protein
MLGDIPRYVRSVILQCAVLPTIRDREKLSRFREIRSQYWKVYRALSVTDSKLEIIDLTPAGYDWKTWSRDIRQAFRKKVPLNFLRQPTIAKTMVFGGMRDFDAANRRVEVVREAYTEECARRLLVEDYIGLPRIVNAKYKTSANRAHHAYHLASYQIATQRTIWNCGCIVEWGGGYGGMARIIRRSNKSITYILIDLPELCALQYVYLASLEGHEEVNLVLPGTSVARGKVNIVPVGGLFTDRAAIHGDAFISTWALSESSKELQKLVVDRRFFGASGVLLAYREDEYSHLKESVGAGGFMRVPVSLLGEGHEYAFR